MTQSLDGFRPMRSADTKGGRRAGCWLYCFIRDGGVVYIGSTVTLGARMKAHRLSRRFDDAEVLVRPCADAVALEREEARLIAEHRPPCNVQGVTAPYRRNRAAQTYNGPEAP